VAELAQRVPLLAIWLILVVTGGYPSWSLAVLVVAMLAAVWWAYRPNGRGTRLLEANRMNPRRGFEWVTNQSADTTDDSVASWRQAHLGNLTDAASPIALVLVPLGAGLCAIGFIADRRWEADQTSEPSDP